MLPRFLDKKVPVGQKTCGDTHFQILREAKDLKSIFFKTASPLLTTI